MRHVIACVILAAVGIVSGPPPVAAAAAPTARTLSPGDFGARGDGVADDTAALQRALDALAPGDTLRVPRGQVFRHTDILTIRTAGVRVTGPGALLATNEARSEVFVDADRVVLDGGLVLRMGVTTRRWDAFEQMKLRVGGRSGVVVRDVTIDGAAAAGLYVGSGASGFQLDDVRVRGTRADGIHITGAAHDGVVRRPVVEGTGDDGVAVVSYENDGAPVRRITVESPKVTGNSWGRGISVVGGEDITYRDVQVTRANAAAVYIASEGAPFHTYAPRRVRVLGGVLDGANANPTVDHGAVLVYAGRPDMTPSDVLVSRMTIRNTRVGASWQVGVIADTGAGVSDVRFDTFALHGGGNAFTANVSGGFVRSNWRVQGEQVVAAVGTTPIDVPRRGRGRR
ncbi:hypothetical protein GTR02_04620 [Kineococcus sp. R8]|uniref:glycosyl hydrolase family 28-related protein n=1 Tax=Kineococcus siccus TaxID=2696567 RepID=UPI0014121CED|nr:right-handed parallel beta-helix repeat-containing protein [Kineococcus siccus]NAZ81097.1 hypothetical protein [Kineococcus siccus]